MPQTRLRHAENAAVRRRLFRAVRRARGFAPDEAAVLWGAARRSYEYFESGDAALDLRRLERFAAIMSTDAETLFLALALDDPRLALRCADNRLGAAVFDFVARLNLRLGDGLATLDADVIREALDEAASRLAATAGRRAAPGLGR